MNALTMQCAATSLRNVVDNLEIAAIHLREIGDRSAAARARADATMYRRMFKDLEAKVRASGMVTP